MRGDAVPRSRMRQDGESVATIFLVIWITSDFRKSANAARAWRLGNSLIGTSSAIFIREMAFQIHDIMKHSPNLDPTVVEEPVHEEVPWVTHLADRGTHMVATVSEMVRPRRRRDLRTSMAACAIWIGGDVEDGPHHQGLVTEPAPLSEMLVAPFEDRLDIPLSAWREAVLGHRITHLPSRARRAEPHADRSCR